MKTRKMIGAGAAAKRKELQDKRVSDLICFLEGNFPPVRGSKGPLKPLKPAQKERIVKRGRNPQNNQPFSPNLKVVAQKLLASEHNKLGVKKLCFTSGKKKTEIDEVSKTRYSELWNFANNRDKDEKALSWEQITKVSNLCDPFTGEKFTPSELQVFKLFVLNRQTKTAQDI